MLSSGLPNGCRADTIFGYERAVERVIRGMRAHLDETFSEERLCLKGMARVAIMSCYHFDRIFRQRTGIPPCQFLSALRIQAAKRLLLTSQLSVTDVSLEVGYNSLGTFVRRFTDLTGLSPGRFRTGAKLVGKGMLNELGSYSAFEAGQFNSGLCGQITAPEDFCGIIFVGLFDTPIPQRSPKACTVVNKPGYYQITPVPTGRFYLFAIGLAVSKDINDYFLYESALRGGGYSILVQRAVVSGSTNLSLRPPTVFDPPILLALPHLLAGRSVGQFRQSKVNNL